MQIHHILGNASFCLDHYVAPYFLITGPAILEQYLTNKYPNLRELEILREMVCYITYVTMGHKLFCFSGPELLEPYFGGLFLSVCLTQTKLHAYTRIKSKQTK